jgi:hypothetical protein
MIRYHFNLHEGNGTVEDEEGRELADLDAVRSEALKGVRSIVAEEATQSVIDLRGRLEVLDSQGRLVLVIGFREAVEILI